MDAVVFDFDGVIIASLEQHVQAYADVLAPLGAKVQARDVLLREGARSETIIQDLLGDAGITVDDARAHELADEKQLRFKALGTPKLYPGAIAMLEATWKTGVKTAIVTGTRRTNLDRLIPDLIDRFDAVIAQESYDHDKPHPEPYQTAADALGIPTDQCICVENAIRGIQSAKAAGYGLVIGITTTVSAEDLAQASPDVTVPDHAAVVTAMQEVLA